MHTFQQEYKALADLIITVDCEHLLKFHGFNTIFFTPNELYETEIVVEQLNWQEIEEMSKSTVGNHLHLLKSSRESFTSHRMKNVLLYDTLRCQCACT